jgi:octaprenyl-diphosphate synthase
LDASLRWHDNGLEFMNFTDIRNLIQNDLLAVDDVIRSELHSSVELINSISEHIIKGGGKRIRPMLTLLVARALSHDTPKAISIAAIIELIHTATLLHDDVVDHSHLRRGLATANSIWGNAPSVLVGDFLYSRSFQMMVALQNMEVMDVLASTTNRIAEGEVLQLMHVHDPDLTEAQYFEIIDCKTAVLFSAASSLGVVITEGNADLKEAMRKYGEHLGRAFQLLDDLLDYSQDAATLGKNRGDDLAEGKTTLPLIYALQQSTGEEAARLRAAIVDGKKEEFSFVYELIQRTGALETLKNKAFHEIEQAKAQLKGLPPSVYKDALGALADFSLSRNH